MRRLCIYLYTKKIYNFRFYFFVIIYWTELLIYFSSFFPHTQIYIHICTIWNPRAYIVKLYAAARIKIYKNKREKKILWSARSALRLARLLYLTCLLSLCLSLSLLLSLGFSMRISQAYMRTYSSSCNSAV